MRNSMSRVTGALLVFAAILGLILSLAGLVVTWIYKPVITENLQDSLTLIGDSLAATAEGMDLIQQSLQTLSASVTSIENTMSTASQTIEDTLPMMDTMATLLDEELPTTVEAVQTSLNSAYVTAQVIDSVLTALTFLNRDMYNPEVPLHTSLANISESLNALPVSFSSMATNIEDTKHNMQIIQVDVALMKDAIRQIGVSISQYEQIIADYRNTLNRVQAEIERLNARLSTTITLIALGMTFFFIWMALAQLGLLFQGWELLGRQNQPALPLESPPVQVEPGESGSE